MRALFINMQICVELINQPFPKAVLKIVHWFFGGISFNTFRSLPNLEQDPKFNSFWKTWYSKNKCSKIIMSNRVGYSPASRPMATLASYYSPAQVAAPKNVIICCNFKITGVMTVNFFFVVRKRVQSVQSCAMIVRFVLDLRKIKSIYFDKFCMV